MSFEIDGPIEPGMVLVARRSKSGRRWRVEHAVNRTAAVPLWVLRPMGLDVRIAQEGGKMNGGVRSIRRLDYEIRQRFQRVA